MATIEELLARANKDQEALNALKKRLSHSHSYTERNSLLKRIRRLEDDLNRLYAQYLRKLKTAPVSVYGTRKKPRVYAGISVQMDVSTDGQYYSNPSPRITNGHRVWVRSRIEMAQKSPFSTVKTEIPEMVRCTWVIPRHWTILDRYSRFGRIEPVVSLPLIITREFKAPSSGTTRANFGMYADPYYYVDPLAPPPAMSQVEITNTWIEVEAGSYYLYTRTSNVLSARTLTVLPDAEYHADDVDQRLFYTDGTTYLLVRAIDSGPYAGKYIVVAQDGITLREEAGQIV